MSSAAADYLYAFRTRAKNTPSEKSGINWFAWTDFHDTSTIL